MTVISQQTLLIITALFGQQFLWIVITVGKIGRDWFNYLPSYLSDGMKKERYSIQGGLERIGENQYTSNIAAVYYVTTVIV